jgi:hypothetical protein
MRDTARKLVMRLTVGNVRLAGSNPAILTLGRCVLCRWSLRYGHPECCRFSRVVITEGQ